MALFRLTRKKPLTIYRYPEGSYVEGVWVEAVPFTVTVQANIQPLEDWQVLKMTEADRTRSWLWVFCESELRPLKEGVGGWDADRFYYRDELYEVMKVKPYDMGILDHYEVKAAKVGPTPDEKVVV